LIALSKHEKQPKRQHKTPLSFGYTQNGRPTKQSRPRWDSKQAAQTPPGDAPQGQKKSPGTIAGAVYILFIHFYTFRKNEKRQQQNTNQ